MTLERIGIRWRASLALPGAAAKRLKLLLSQPLVFACNHHHEQVPAGSYKQKLVELELNQFQPLGGERGIRTHGTQSVQRFSRPPRSTTPASLQSICATRLANCDCKIINFLCHCQLYCKKSSNTLSKQGKCENWCIFWHGCCI